MFKVQQGPTKAHDKQEAKQCTYLGCQTGRLLKRWSRRYKILLAGAVDGTLADLPYHGILDLINASEVH
jgi:hypothetical protein